MRVLHTSDWHLGRALYNQHRQQEFDEFLQWLSLQIDQQRIDTLLVAGDIFDTTTPGNRAQEQYYRFLCRTAASSCCSNVIITAGNHDSPTFLEAPKELLRTLNIQVIGSITDNPADETILLHDRQNQPMAIVCAVPYLRDRDVRKSMPGESIEDKLNNLINGIAAHYQQVADVARHLGNQHPGLPVIGMGHLFTAGGQTVEGDGTRELYVGSLAHVNAASLPTDFDYLALGHLHSAQTVGGRQHLRYSGSPLPMSFADAEQSKKVLIIEFNGKSPSVTELPVPCFQPLQRISGDFSEISTRIEQLKAARSNAWLEIVHTGSAIESDLPGRLEKIIGSCELQILSIQDRGRVEKALQQSNTSETLENITTNEVFKRCLEANQVAPEQHDELVFAYNEIVRQIQEEDVGGSQP
ncbi:MAG: exonuclease SbcCD subunit D C-terminal domain-containing protein [Candidatus Rifleibacteriota bacterium]